jgi:predicted RNA-binding Zn-ribbon protein involved in translation (DUF1610 family)
MKNDGRIYTQCDWCGREIAYGNASVAITRNVEQVDNTKDEAEGIATVIDSDIVLTLCPRCGNKLGCDTLRSVLQVLKHRCLLSRILETGGEFIEFKPRYLN